MAADRFFIITKPAWLLSYNRTNQNVHVVVSLCKIEKQIGMENTGLKIPQKDQIYVQVGFSYYPRAKVFSVLNVRELIRGVMRSRNLKNNAHTSIKKSLSRLHF